MPLKDGSVEDYKGAAARHYTDAYTLKSIGQYDNAGHLIGFAAECAIKHHMVQVSQSSVNLHLPELLAAAKRQLGSRVGYTSLYDVLKTDALAGWAIDYRYAPTGKISKETLEGWCAGAKRILAAAGVRAKS
ncbi:hypothetical protein [Aquabacterium sp.]|uniref:hypothetical protein n=1 Tax=Aquabacterium sp. TaxID=1872578 RepID=UPI003CFF1C8F